MSLGSSAVRRTLLIVSLTVSLAAALPAVRARAAGDAPAPPSGTDKPAAPSGSPTPAAQDAGFAERAKGFYAFLSGRQVNIHSLYENETFRSYFSDEDVLENYIAYITSRLGEHKFRKYRIESSEVESLKPAGPDRATARVKLVGRHRDTLVFWNQSLVIEDPWRRVEGEWYAFPPAF